VLAVGSLAKSQQPSPHRLSKWKYTEWDPNHPISPRKSKAKAPVRFNSTPDDPPKKRAKKRPSVDWKLKSETLYAEETLESFKGRKCQFCQDMITISPFRLFFIESRDGHPERRYFHLHCLKKWRFYEKFVSSKCVFIVGEMSDAIKIQISFSFRLPEIDSVLVKDL